MATPVPTDAQRQQLETLASNMLDSCNCTRPPVPVEQILAHPPEGLQSVDVGDLSLVFGLGDHRYEYRLAMARLLYREICRSGAEGWAQVKLPFNNESSRYFAICLLIPAPWLTKALRNPLVTLEQLSEMFQVPEHAMASRLVQLGKKVRGMS